MDALHLGIALGPLAVYLLVLGMINLRKSPFVTTGARDTAVLGIAISGFIIAGPVRLFMPGELLIQFGGYAWLIMISFYVTSLCLVLVFSRPRIVIYNITASKLRDALEQWAPQIDDQAHWAGDALLLPEYGVQLHIEPFVAMKNVSLVATGPRQSLIGWKAVQPSLTQVIESITVARNPRAYSMLTFGLLMLVMVFWHFTTQSQNVINSWNQWVQF